MAKYKRLFAILSLVLLAGCGTVSDGTSSSYPSMNEESRVEIQAEQNRVTEDNAYGSFSDKTTSIYNDTFDRLMESSTHENDSDMPLSERIFRGGFQIYSVIRSISPFLFVGSIGIGILIWIVARHNKAVRRVGIYGFIIGIPLFLVLFVYGIGIVMDMFLF